jgi:hypothetical protein
VETITKAPESPALDRATGPAPEGLRMPARWLGRTLAMRGISASPKATAGLCAAVFLVAIGVRLLYWQDNYSRTAPNRGWDSALARHYRSEAKRMLDERGVLFPRGPTDPADARLILHPPGYSAFIAALFVGWPDSASAVKLAQIVLDGVSVVMVFLIAGALFNSAVGATAGGLAALSPHLAYYSLGISPDTLCVLPILISAYLVIKAGGWPRLHIVAAAGAMVGASCWMRANALLLAPVLAIAVMLVMPRGRRLACGAAFVAGTVLVISPITIRNWVVYRSFIPLSIAGGENLVVGIADFDREGRFEMPRSDREAALKDAEWHNRPDYAFNPWVPDGVERDQARYARGVQVIRANPGWFLGVMIQRAFFMLTYNGPTPGGWPHNTSNVPIVATEVPPLRSAEAFQQAEPVWTRALSELADGDPVLSSQSAVSVEPESGMLRLTGDHSLFGNQLELAPIALKPRTDYLLTVEAALERGAAAVKVTTADGRKALASEILDLEAAQRAARRQSKKRGEAAPGEHALNRPARLIFSSGNESSARLVVANNGAAAPEMQLGQAQLFELGSTPLFWTRFPRAIVRPLQRNVFKTSVLLPLVIAGVLLLWAAGRGRALALLLAVPIYYLCFQSALSTEYRYILAIHYFLFIASGVTLYCLAMLATQMSPLKRFGVNYRADLKSRPQ